MANRWIEFVRKWSAKEGISYACAVSKPECRAEYQAKYGNRKKLPMRTEREIMGAEDIRSRTLEKQKKKKPALIIEESDEEEYILPKKTPLPKRTQKSIATEMVSPKLKQVMEKLKMLQEDLQSQMIMKKQMTATLRSKLSKELKTILDEKKRLVELSRMMGEDKDAPSVSKVNKEVEKIETKIKKAKTILIEDDEEVPKKKATKQKKKTAKEIREEEKRKKEEEEAKERADFYASVLTSFKKEQRDVLPKEIYKKIQEWIIGKIRSEEEYEDALEDSSYKYMNTNLEPELRNAFRWVYGKIYAKNQEEEEKKAPKKKAKKAKDELEDVFASMLKASKKNVNDDDDDDDDDEN